MFLCGIYVTGLAVGILVLFVFHRALVSQEYLKTGQVQIFIGVAALVIAVFVAGSVRVPQLSRRRPPSEPTVSDADGTETEVPDVAS